MLAAAKIHRLGLAGIVFDRDEASSFVRAAAKRLIGRFAAGTPVIGFPRFDHDGVRHFLGNYRFRHEISLGRPRHELEAVGAMFA